MYKIDPLDDARFDFKVDDEVIVLSTAGAKLGEGVVKSESAPGLYGVEMTTGRYAGRSKGLNGCLLRPKNPKASEEESTAELAFYDHERQNYASAVPIADAGEFMVGDYGPTGNDGVGELGEFKITLVDLRGVGGGDPTKGGLSPQVHAFGDGCRALVTLVEICGGDLTELLADVADSAAFSRRLLDLGLLDHSDAPLEG